MATVTDTLTTVLQLVGAPQFAAGMGTAAAAAGTLAAAEGTAAVATEGLIVAAVGLDAVLAPLIALAAPLLTIGAAMGFIGKAVHEFADVQSRAFQTSVVLKNLGSSIPIEELQSLGSEIQRLTGFDDDLVVSLGGVLARFGIAGKDIPNVVRAIADTAAGTGQSLEEVGSAVTHALAGRGQALKQLGVEFKATGNRAKDLATIEAELEKRFSGAGAARRNTITGAFDALSNATGNFFSAIGRILGPGVIAIINKFADALQSLADRLEGLADRLGIAKPQDAASTIGKGLKGDPKQTALLGEIAGNTGPNGALAKQLLSGKGEAVARAFTHRDAIMALAH